MYTYVYVFLNLLVYISSKLTLSAKNDTQLLLTKFVFNLHSRENPTLDWYLYDIQAIHAVVPEGMV